MLLIVFSQTQVSQLFKLPLLIEHFAKHKYEQKISFVKFIVEHYSTKHIDADLPEDNNLPFKNASLMNFEYAVLPSVLKAEFLQYSFLSGKVILPESFCSQPNLCSIFHPPRE